MKGEINTQSIEGFFSIVKRGFRGIYQHCAEKHLHRYLAEFDFSYSHHRITDWGRTSIALKGIGGLLKGQKSKIVGPETSPEVKVWLEWFSE